MLFQVNDWMNEMVSGRLELNLSWGVFPGIWMKFCNKGKHPALNAADKLVFREIVKITGEVGEMSHWKRVIEPGQAW